MDECVFCKIANGESPAYIVYSDEKTIAFLDINPIAEGHTLIIPRKHFENLSDVDEEYFAACATTCRIVSDAMVKSGMAKGTNLLLANGAAANQSIFHVHFHILPRYPGDGSTFIEWWGRSLRHYTPEKMNDIAKKLRVD